MSPYSKAPRAIALLLFIAVISCTPLSAQLINIDPTWGNQGVRTVDFGSTEEDYVSAVRQADGKMLLMGTVDFLANTKISLARVLPNGQLDNTFGQNGKLILTFDAQKRCLPYRIMVHSDGKIYVAFILNHNNTDTRMMVRLLPNGSIDNTFADNGYYQSSTLWAGGNWGPLKIMPDGKIHCYALSATVIDGVPYSRLVSFRIMPDGKPDTSYSNPYKFHALGPDEKFRDGVFYLATNSQQTDLLYCTRQNALNNTLTRFIVKIKSNGNFDSTFGTNGLYAFSLPGVQNSNTGIAIDPANGRILLPGIYRRTNVEQQAPAVYAFKPNGGIDSAYGTNGLAIYPLDVNLGFGAFIASDITFDNQGRHYISFAGKRIDVTMNTFAAARFLQNGQIDASFGEGGSIISNLQGICDKIFLDSDLLPIVSGRTSLSTIAINNDLVLAKLKQGGTISIMPNYISHTVYPTQVRAHDIIHLPMGTDDCLYINDLQGKNIQWNKRTFTHNERGASFTWPGTKPGVYLLRHPGWQAPVKVMVR